MSDLIHQLTLAAGLNTNKRIQDYLQISDRTWYRKQEKGQLKRVELEALRHKAGYLLHGHFRGFKIVKNKLYSPENNFANPREIANMTAIRELIGACFTQIDQLKERISTLEAGYQTDLFNDFEILHPKYEDIRLKKLFDLAI